MSVMKCQACVNHHVTMDVTNNGNWQRAQQTGNEKWEQNGELEMKLLHDGIGSKVGFVPIFHFCLFPFSVLVTRYPLQ